MNTEMSKNLVCILMREGVEIWIEAEKLEPLMGMLETKRFIKIEGRIINTADISGIYPAGDMENLTRRKNGQWKDQKGIWHDKGERVCKCGNVVPFGKQCGICA
jgi:hypothetical protein